jgi:salicylate 5-hydroxylase large subunit
MPEDFKLEEHSLQCLQVTERHGVIFASFDPHVRSLEEYLGPSMLFYFDRIFDGRELRVLGYMRQRIRSNWKLMFENIKDPYHASLLHVFLVTFGLFRADQPSAVKMDETGRHAVLVSRRGEQKASEGTSEMKSFRANFTLQDPKLLTPVKEFPGDATVVMQTLWPNLMLWTFFGYGDDSEEMTQLRLRQANLMGPSGLVSIDDSEMMELSQNGIGQYPDAAAVIELGGRDARDEDHMVTEAPVRGFYKYYREVMGL